MRGTYAFQPMAYAIIAASLFQQWKVTAAVDEPVTAALCADQFMHICGHGGYLRMYAAQVVKLGIEKVTVRCRCYMEHGEKIGLGTRSYELITVK